MSDEKHRAEKLLAGLMLQAPQPDQPNTEDAAMAPTGNTGGAPLLCPPLPDVVTHATRVGVQTVVVPTGMLFRPHRLEAIVPPQLWRMAPYRAAAGECRVPRR